MSTRGKKFLNCIHAVLIVNQKSVIVQLWGKQVGDKKPVNVAAKKGKYTKAIIRAETKKQTVSIALLCDVIRHCQYNQMAAA